MSFLGFKYIQLVSIFIEVHVKWKNSLWSCMRCWHEIFSMHTSQISRISGMKTINSIEASDKCTKIQAPTTTTFVSMWILKFRVDARNFAGRREISRSRASDNFTHHPCERAQNFTHINKFLEFFNEYSSQTNIRNRIFQWCTNTSIRVKIQDLRHSPELLQLSWRLKI